MVPVLEAVPNFSEGRDLDLVRELVSVVEAHDVEVLDWSADPDHHRSVMTYIGPPAAVVDAAVAAAGTALERIDLTRHRGVHPRIGALDVLPFVPLQGVTLDDADGWARLGGERIAELGVPVYWYGGTSLSGRGLAEIRRGGFEALRDGQDPDRRPDLDAGRGGALHPTAGATCVGARRLLLAWNVFVEGVPLEELRSLADGLRERSGGHRGLRVLALELPSTGRFQISMNLEDVQGADPFAVFRDLEARVESLGGTVAGTEVIGMIPSPLVLPAATDRLRLFDAHASRLLPTRLADHVSRRAIRALDALKAAVETAGAACPPGIRDAVEHLSNATRTRPGDSP